MAYSHPSLFRIGGTDSQAPVLWSYATADTIATVNTAGYFNDASDDLSIGDIIFIRSSTGGTQVVSINYVLTNAAGIVDVNDGTVLAATDGD